MYSVRSLWFEGAEDEREEEEEDTVSLITEMAYSHQCVLYIQSQSTVQERGTYS